jgi:hypothetical protein
MLAPLAGESQAPSATGAQVTETIDEVVVPRAGARKVLQDYPGTAAVFNTVVVEWARVDGLDRSEKRERQPE